MTPKPLAGADDWEMHWRAYALAARRNPAQRYRHQQMVKTLRRLGAAPGRRLLDLGSGQGDFLALADRMLPGLELLGFELSREGVEISSALVPRARFFQVDVFAPPPELEALQGWADYATCSEVLEHLDDPVDFLVRATDYLAPGARLLVTVPSGPMSAFDRHIGHRTHFDEAKLGALAEKAGLEPIRLWRAGFPFFNLYRCLVVMSGRRLIDTPSAGQGRGAQLIARVFNSLFHANLPSSRWGWQLMALLRRP